MTNKRQCVQRETHRQFAQNAAESWDPTGHGVIVIADQAFDCTRSQSGGYLIPLGFALEEASEVVAVHMACA